LNNINLSLELISDRIGSVHSQSKVYETVPWRHDSELLYLNQLVSVQTSLSPPEVLSKIKDIEKELGRTRNEEQWSDRTIDIDILFYDDEVINTNQLTIPHPRIPLRKFALEPLNELDSALVHPVLNKSISTLYKECEDKNNVSVFNR